MGRGGQDEPAGKSGITSDEKKGRRRELWAISPSRSVVEMPDI